MKLLTIVASLLLSAQLSFGMSLHPCTPTVQARDTEISCKEGDYYFSIQIKTLMSPRSVCEGKDYREYQTAVVSFGKGDGQNQTFEIEDGKFSYSSVGGEATFSSPENEMELKRCATPMHSGFSIGN